MTADVMRVFVEQIREIAPTCTIMFGDGTTGEGVDITFAGSRREMQDIADQIAASGKPVIANVEHWQIWSLGEG